MKSKKHDCDEPLGQFHEDEQVFVEGVMARGEAAKPVDGDLPPGATHEVVDDDGEGPAPKIRRKRFKAF